MNLAKHCIDVGVRTNNIDAMLEFWTKEVGLPYMELLKVGGGVHQHRLSLKGSIFKGGYPEGRGLKTLDFPGSKELE